MQKSNNSELEQLKKLLLSNELNQLTKLENKLRELEYFTRKSSK